MVSSLPAMLTGYLIGSIEPTKSTAGIRTAILSPIFTPIQLPILAAIFLPDIACLRHPTIISTSSATVFTRSAAHRSWTAIERTGSPIIHSRRISTWLTRLTDRWDTGQE
jgi:hypothetical protein